MHPGTRERIRSFHDVVRGIAADDQTFGWLMAIPAHVDRMLNELLLGKRSIGAATLTGSNYYPVKPSLDPNAR